MKSKQPWAKKLCTGNEVNCQKTYIHNISFPFRLKGDDPSCGGRIQLVDPDLDQHDYCSIPRHSFTVRDDDSLYFSPYYDYEYKYFMTCP